MILDPSNSVNDTIFALASGRVPAGVAIIRISGPECAEICLELCGVIPEPRRATLLDLRDPDPDDDDIIDRCLVLTFEEGASYTGEAVVEFHCHGSVAVIERLATKLSSFDRCRAAEAGEFTKRAFENGVIDLLELEGLSDLIASQTELQRKHAFKQASGQISKRFEALRSKLLSLRANIEALLDFSDEDDVDDTLEKRLIPKLDDLYDEISLVLKSYRFAERVRDRFEVVLAGEPNAGKSSLLNAIAAREAAIVSDLPGTTRDFVEVQLDLEGLPVVLVDTAGLRDSDDSIEQIGISRSRARIKSADVVLLLSDRSCFDNIVDVENDCHETIRVRTKGDLGYDDIGSQDLAVSIHDDDSIMRLLSVLRIRLIGRGLDSDVTINRVRHKQCLEDALRCIGEVRRQQKTGLDVMAEELRRASRALDSLLGYIDVEDLLGAIYSEFCIGK